MPAMATRQQPPSAAKTTPQNGPTIFWLIVVVGLIGIVYYFGFIKVD
jgi:hypothetical protein